MTLSIFGPRTEHIISVAVPVPLRQSFDFLVPLASSENEIRPTIGARVKVPFGSRKLVGVIIAVKSDSEFPENKLKAAIEILDQTSLFDDALWSSLVWLSRYYLAPIGEVLDAALPVALRQASELMPSSKKTWTLTELGRSRSIDELNRAPLQLAIIKLFMNNSLLNADDFKDTASSWRQAINALVEKGWVEETQSQPMLAERLVDKQRLITLTEQQAEAVEVINERINQQGFWATLLHGVTGSGKTEVYFSAMETVLAKGQQILLMVPEIGLTPQLIERVKHRFSEPLVVMHSALNDTERHLAWWHASQGNAKIVIGTRSSVFSSFANLGLIIIDEEHDGSFKQQDGVRYQARDVAIYRAKQQGVAIILGSATPSLETFVNAESGRYTLLQLSHRATKVELPSIELIDLNMQPTNDGLSPGMLEAIKGTLSQGRQVMLFLNRRGYAPVLYCKDCKQTAKCHRCDSHLTLHRRVNRMRCHHCGYEGQLQTQCAACQSEEMVDLGEGTQRVEDAIAFRFPEASVLRIDRDSTSRKGELAEVLEQARSGAADILIGTQLITKGHDFPNVGMVGILEADQGLYSTDFRASEALFQQILQVSGRAGRRGDVGRVFIQTNFPENPFFEKVITHDFVGFAKGLMQERKAAQFPPFGFFALIRAESPHQAQALQFLRKARHDIKPSDGVRLMDAVPAPMERRAGKFRAQLLLCSNQRSALNHTLTVWLHLLATDKEAKKLANSVRWSLDIDPLDHF
ncbi:MAG: primosomal protein N' (replication factor Y) [Arenicella sp.]|jgi:primosomal protein N' (replication factor Y)